MRFWCLQTRGNRILWRFLLVCFFYLGVYLIRIFTFTVHLTWNEMHNVDELLPLPKFQISGEVCIQILPYTSLSSFKKNYKLYQSRYFNAPLPYFFLENGTRCQSDDTEVSFCLVKDRFCMNEHWLHLFVLKANAVLLQFDSRFIAFVRPAEYCRPLETARCCCSRLCQISTGMDFRTNNWSESSLHILDIWRRFQRIYVAVRWLH